MSVATLSIDLEARLARLENDLKGASSLIERESAKMAKHFGGVNEVFKGSLAADAVSELAARFAQLVPNVVDGIDKLNDLADATGSTVENISALEDIALRTGGSIDTVAQSLVKFNAQLGNAKAGSDQALILESIGLSAEKLRQMDPADALLATAKALDTFGEGGKKARIVQELFGKSVQEVGPFLKDLADRGELVAKVTTEQAKAAERFNQAVASLKKDSLDLSRVFASNLLEAVGQVTGAFKDADQYAGQLQGTAANLAVPLQALAVLGANVAFVFKGVGTEIGAIAAQGVALAQLDFEAVKAIRSAAVEDANAARARIDELEKRILNLRGASNDELRRKEDRGFTPTKPQPPDPKAKAAISDAQRYIDSLNQQIEATQKLTEYEQALNRIRKGDFALKGEAPRILALAAEVDATKELIRLADERAAQRKKDYDDAEAAFRANQEADRERLRSFKDMTGAATMERFAADIDYLREKMYAGKLEADEYADIILKLMERLGVMAPKVKGLADQVGEAFGGALETLIVDGGRARDVIRALEQDIVRLFIRQQVTQPAAKELGTFLSGFLASADGNAFAGGQLQPFAQGGTVSQPTLFTYGGGRKGLMGEAGTEGILPLKRGRDGKLGVIAQGGSVGSVTNNYITVPMVPGGDRRTAMQQGEIIGRQVALAQRRNG